jgi:hypothetical protein
MPAEANRSRTVTLATGTLHLEVERALWPLQTLCDFVTYRPRRR